jgi:hypothetical protein
LGTFNNFIKLERAYVLPEIEAKKSLKIFKEIKSEPVQAMQII